MELERELDWARRTWNGLSSADKEKIFAELAEVEASSLDSKRASSHFDDFYSRTRYAILDHLKKMTRNTGEGSKPQG